MGEQLIDIGMKLTAYVTIPILVIFGLIWLISRHKK